MPVINVERLRKSYARVPVVDAISFQVEAGEIFGLLGPNGAGKTTTVECLQGLRRPDGGDVRVLGLDPWRRPTELRKRIGSQLQESSLPDRLSVGEALAFFSAPGRDWRRLAGEWGLEAKLKTAFADLSGGQRQRLFVALALVNEPELVFLDEMTTGLDPAARRVAWELIEAIRGRGTTVVLVTHFMEEAERLCDRVAILSRGRLVASGPPSQLISAYAGDVHVRFTSDQPVDWLRSVPHVLAFTRSRLGAVEVVGEGAVLAEVGAALVAHGQAPADLAVERRTLEDVFLRLTDGERPAA